jgi:methylenetetrahydrofolate reductase (NADPH)
VTAEPLIRPGAAPHAALLARASIEINPHDIPAAAREGALLPRGIDAFIPWLPDTQPSQVVECALHVRELGFNPVPHLAARRIGSEAQAHRLAEQLADEAGVTRVLLIGGDVGAPLGSFDSSFALMETGLLHSAGIREVGFAGYPEGHPTIARPRLEDALEAKLAYARANGLEPFIVSQFCFDGAVIARWLATLRRREPSIDVRLGIAGPTKLRKLLSLGLRCGVGASLRTLKGKAGALSALVATHSPDALLEEFVKSYARSLDGERVSVHLFAFGGVEAAAQWLSKAARSFVPAS